MFTNRKRDIFLKSATRKFDYFYYLLRKSTEINDSTSSLAFCVDVIGCGH